MLRIALLSRWHVHASGYARFIAAQADACITCVWDEDRIRGIAWAEELSVPFEPDIDVLLARSDVDAVLICAPTRLHHAIMLKAAAAGKHIFTEKVMCLTTADCADVAAAIKQAGVIFTISFPQRCLGRNLFIKEQLDRNILGDITLVRIRDAHDGASGSWLPAHWYDPVTTGGGAMMDLGAHPMYLARWLLGKPRTIQSTFASHTGRAVEDNAVSVLSFESGALAIAETSLVSPLAPKLLEVYGTNGVIIAEDQHVRMRIRDPQAPTARDWVEVRTLPADLPLPLRQFIDSVLYHTPVRFGCAEGLALTELMERAYQADHEKLEVAF